MYFAGSVSRAKMVSGLAATRTSRRMALRSSTVICESLLTGRRAGAARRSPSQRAPWRLFKRRLTKVSTNGMTPATIPAGGLRFDVDFLYPYHQSESIRARRGHRGGHSQRRAVATVEPAMCKEV